MHKKWEFKSNNILTKIYKTEEQLRQKDTGDELKFIDFHQLQIQNKKHVKDIDEKNKKLKEMKQKASETLANLNAIKRELSELTGDNDKKTKRDNNFSR